MGFDVSNFPPGPHNPKFRMKFLALLNSNLEFGFCPLAIFGMEALLPGFISSAKFTGVNAVELKHPIVPNEAIFSNVIVPDP